MKKTIIALLATLTVFIACGEQTAKENTDPFVIKGETHLKNIRMLTDHGENAEAYFSFSGSQLIYQSTNEPYQCDQIFTMNLDGSEKNLVSTGKGRTTCSYFLPGDQQIIYASTHAENVNCPPAADMSNGYVWKTYASFDLYIANADGSDPKPFLPAPGYDAEATVSPVGYKIVFTSQRDGDLDIYTVNLDGSNLRRLTTELGYDGGPFFSWDGKKIVYRSYHPKSKAEVERYKKLLADEMIEPNAFQVWVMDVDGSNKRQITDNEFANFAPFYHPDNKRIIYVTNEGSSNTRKPDFNFWMINEDGSNKKQISRFDGFDGFPMFSKNGKQLVFASNRSNKKKHDTNIFIADWVE